MNLINGAIRNRFVNITLQLEKKNKDRSAEKLMKTIKVNCKIKENCRKLNSRIQTPTLFSQKRTLLSGEFFSELELLERRTIENKLQN